MISAICAGLVHSSDALVVFCAVFYLIAFLFFLTRTNGKKQIFFLTVFLGLAAGLTNSLLYSHVVIDPCRDLSGDNREITLEATDFPEIGDGYIRVSGRITDSALPHVRILLYVYDNTISAEYFDSFSLSKVKPGDLLSANVRLKSSDIRYGKTNLSYYSAGIFLTANAKGEIRKLGEKTGFISCLRYLPVKASQKLSDVLSDLFPGEEGAFMKSLLINDRDDFYSEPSLSPNLSRSGIMHVVAVSGMHIAFLVGFIRLILGNSRKSSLLCLAIIWFFVLMTGAVPSAVRAGFMQSMLLIASFFRRESDSPTSLAFALLILLLINPYAIFSVGLQLSFAAVGGILVFSVPLYKTFSKKLSSLGRLAAYLFGILSTSVGVTIFTLPLTAWHFGSVSVLSVVTNILVLWAVSLCFIGGLFSALSFMIVPIVGRLLAVPVRFLSLYILKTAAMVAEIPFSTIYISNADTIVLYWVFGTYILFSVFLCLRNLSGKAQLGIPAMISSASLFLILSGCKLYYQAYPAVYSALNVGQGQCLTVFSGNDTVVIDCGSTMTAGNAGDVAGKYLLSCGRDHINTLLLTHLHEDHANGVTTLMEYLPVDEIVLPAEFAEDNEILPQIRLSAEKHNTRITYLSGDAVASVGKIRIRLFVPSETPTKSDQNEKCMICILSVGDYDMLVTGDSSKAAEQKLLISQDLPEIDLLILGHHGSKSASSQELLEFCAGADGIISVGYNTYGHPSDETVLRAESFLNSVYRTDTSGSLQMILKDGDIMYG